MNVMLAKLLLISVGLVSCVTTAFLTPAPICSVSLAFRYDRQCNLERRTAGSHGTTRSLHWKWRERGTKLRYLEVHTTRRAAHNNNDNDEKNDCLLPSDNGRRQLLETPLHAASLCLGLSFVTPPPLAQARGLVQFPCTEPLGNTYHFMRAGQSLLEEQDIWSTNPLFLTNRENALSELGMEQVVASARAMNDNSVMIPTVIEYSLAAHAMDTAAIVGKECRLGRDRVLAEYTFLDPRAVGKWDMLPLSSTQPAVWAMDNDEASKYNGQGPKPPPNEDSTPNESLADQAVRLRQLFSIVESLYSGDTVLLVFPDGAGPALLSALIAGIPLNRCHELEYAPGEVRLSVTAASTQALWKEKQQHNREYRETLEEGRQELVRLRSMSPDELVSMKDQQLENERLEQESLAEQRAVARQQKEDQERRTRQERARQVEEARQLRIDGGESDVDGRIVLPVGLGVAGIGAATVLAMPERDDDATSLVESEPIMVGSNGTSAFPTLGDRDQRSSRDGAKLSTTKPELSDRVVTDMKALGTAAVLDATQGTLSKPKAKDRKEAADEAMKEYMEKDDGGEAWLRMMVDMADDEDDKNNLL